MRKCKYCDEKIQKNYVNKIFCNRKCSGLWHRNRHRTGCKKIKMRKCKYCGKTIEKKKKDTVTSYETKIFCDMVCYARFRTGKSPHVFKKIKLRKCLICNRIILRYKNKKRAPNYNKRKYCSYECHHESMKMPFEKRYGIKKSKQMKKKNSIFFTKLYNGVSFKERYGKIKGLEIAKKIGDSQRGENGNNWQGGASFEPYDTNFNKCLKRQIAKRDKYICQLCGKKTFKGVCHHIHYVKVDSRQETLIFLHNSCHSRTNSNRDYWFAYFCNMKGICPSEMFV